jgi:hypothetical protein
MFNLRFSGATAAGLQLVTLGRIYVLFVFAMVEAHLHLGIVDS